MEILKKLESVREELQNNEKIIQKLRIQLDKYDKKYSVADTVKGGMGGKQHYTITGFPYEEYKGKKTALLSYNLKHEILLEKYEQAEYEAEKYIYTIDTSQIRLIMKYRYLDGLEWNQIAMNIHGNCKGDAVRVLHDRYVKSVQEHGPAAQSSI